MAVKVKRERPDQRRHHRVTAPLFVDVGDYRIRATDWSLGGLRIDGYPEAVPDVGDPLKLHLALPFQGFDVSFAVQAEVVRTDPATGMFAVKFTEVGERERELMSHFIEELVRGSMSDVEDTIQRIDVPVTPASLKPDANPMRELPVQRWPVKVVAMSALYALIGFMVFGYTGILIYTNFAKLEVQTAVITAPVEQVVAQADGQIKIGAVKPGEPVKAGQVVVSLYDNQIERDLELAEIKVREQKAKLAFLKQRHADELERVKGFATVELKNVKQTQLEVEGLVAQLHQAEMQRQRLTLLHNRGFTTDARLEEAEKQVTTLKKALESKRIELSSRAELAEQNHGKRLFTGDSIIGDVSQIEAEVRLAEHEVELARQRQQALHHQNERVAIKAPFDGIVSNITRADNAQVRRGDVIAVIEQRQDRGVTAFLTQAEVNRIGLGDEVTILVPSLGETLKARVTAVDRTSGFVREQDQRNAPGYGWRGPADRSARVQLEFLDRGVRRDWQRYRSGLPVIAIFPQRSTNSVLNMLRHRFALAS